MLTGTPDQIVEQLAALGAVGIDEVIIVDWNLADGPERMETLHRFADEVLSAL